MAHLLAKDAAGAETTFALPDSGAVVIGRSAGRSDLVVPGLAVSGRHCSLSRVGGAFLLRDLGSTNGTRLNGTPLSPETDMPVWRGDRIDMADFQVVLEGDDVPSRPAAPAPAPAPAGSSALPAGVRAMQPAPESPAAPEPTPPKAPSGDYARTAVVGSSGFGIAPRTVRDAPAKGLPGDFRRKTSKGGLWLALVGLALVAAVFLVFRLVGQLS